ncbi:MAG: bifunctional 3-demethylubiquinol 3-O-methyltransferase/2-polyprenyl-6-hydroxyphenol methylase, partial [Pseudomonadales bacterium]|nr:bifunctional 3-demethylubiquinol 3-O-methyltransferase/2-polyprenyl-6-hydroxyphenol methylase [Pseudomonadales bacterium]
SKFIKPSELAAAIRDAGLELQEIRGMSYNPVTRNAALNDNTSANYIVHAKKVG